MPEPGGRRLSQRREHAYASHLALTENGLKFFVPMDPTNNYENTYIW